MVTKKLDQSSIWGKILWVNLTNSKCIARDMPKQLFKHFLGGRGLGDKLLFDEIDPNVDPLSKDNKLIFAAGPLTGTRAPTGCRYEVITKSPLTGTITSANSGGFFGTVLKRSGLDAIVIQGRAERLAYLNIDNDEYSILDARELAGYNTHETTDWIIDSTGNKKTSVACIGPAGENLVKFACIINDKHRAAGRGGTGAVLGSKNLKAVALTGSKKIDVVQPDNFKNQVKKITGKIKNNKYTHMNLPKYGTANILAIVNDHNLFGARNFQQNNFEFADDINAEQLRNTLLVKTTSCHGCPIGCKRVTRVDDEQGEGPEFETIWAFGAQCGVNDLKAITIANYICNKLGLDTISTGSTIGCAMELSEKKILDRNISFGDSTIIRTLTKQIAYREDIGDKLAEGSFSFASALGHPELSMSVKKLELPAYDPRGGPAQGLGYATSNRGGCHVRAQMIRSDMAMGPKKLDRELVKEMVNLVIEKQDLTAVMDSIGVCLFSSLVCDIDDYLGLLNSATGLNFKSSIDLLKAGERIWNLERVFNQKVGFSHKDDILPNRFKSEPVLDIFGRKRTWPEKEMISEYYKKRGWSKNGMPTKKQLSELGI